jgi:tetratricopeptide (TPR) repeat protein
MNCEELDAALQQELQYGNTLVKDRPNKPEVYVQRGMARFKLAQIAESIQDFDRAEQLEPSITPYLWQRGLSYYYAERFQDGAQQFEVDLTVNRQDLEETIWRYLCLAQIQAVEDARRSLQVVNNDPRPIMRHIYNFYAGTCAADDVLRAGRQGGTKEQFYSHLYLGLYYEVANEPQQAQAHVAIATEQYPVDAYMWHLARVHRQLRGWEQ